MIDKCAWCKKDGEVQKAYALKNPLVCKDCYKISKRIMTDSTPLPPEYEQILIDHWKDILAIRLEMEIYDQV